MTQFHSDLLLTKALLYDPYDVVFSSPSIENESAEYAACTFKLDHLNITFRVAKITPTKIGQFVTLWKRVSEGPIQPHDIEDPIDLVVISARDGNNFGQFVFPKAVLIEQNIFSKEGKGGKLGFRVYPPWDKTTSRQAQKTQEWQLKYFLDMSDSSAIDAINIKRFYSQTL